MDPDTSLEADAPTRLLLAVAILALAAGCPDDQDGAEDAGPSEDVAASDTDEATDATDTTDTDEAPDTADADRPDTSDADAGQQAIAIDDLEGEVTARFDSNGVLHLECETAHDCYRAQGYFHADHRFFMMDAIRRQTRGQIAELVGELGLSSDEKFRKLMTTREGEPLETAYVEAASEETKRMLRSYASGVNAWLDDVENDENGASLTEEYDHPIIDEGALRDWEPEDTVALYLQLAFQLGDSSQDDLFRGDVAASLEPEVAEDLVTVRPGFTSNIMQSAGVSEPSSLTEDRGGFGLGASNLEQIHQRLAPAKRAIGDARDQLQSDPSVIFGPRDTRDGSNNWAVGPDRTESGDALLADDPHLTLNNPSIWYMVEMRTTDDDNPLHVAGGSIPAVPGIVVGQNEDIAWGVTTARLDQADAYIETLTDSGDAVMRDGGTVDLKTKTYEFDVRGGSTSSKTFEWVPNHGPIISKDEANNRAVSVKWVAQTPGADLDFIQPLMRAETVSEAKTALDPARIINQNWVFADRDGSIGWTPHSSVPKRPWASSETPNWMPLPGDGSAEWDGKLDDGALPELTDPPKGFIATANNDMDGSYSDGDATNDGHQPWQYPPVHGSRHARIVEQLEAGGDSHTPETMHELQADTHSLPGERLVPYVLDETDSFGDSLPDSAQKLVSALEAWNYTCPTGLDGHDPEEASLVEDDEVVSEARGCAAFHALLPHLTDQAFGDELADSDDFDPYSGWHDFQNALVALFHEPGTLNRGTEYFDDVTTEETETKTDVVRAALEAAGSSMESAYGSSNPEDWIWGRAHTLTFSAPLFSMAGFSNFDNGPYASDGGWGTVDVADPPGRAATHRPGETGFEGEFHHGKGASIRLVFRAGDDAIDGWFQLPGGQSHHRDSQWYGSLVDEWLADEPTKLRFDADEVEADAERTRKLVPAP